MNAVYQTHMWVILLECVSGWSIADFTGYRTKREATKAMKDSVFVLHGCNQKVVKYDITTKDKH